MELERISTVMSEADLFPVSSEKLNEVAGQIRDFRNDAKINQIKTLNNIAMQHSDIFQSGLNQWQWGNRGRKSTVLYNYTRTPQFS